MNRLRIPERASASILVLGVVLCATFLVALLAAVGAAYVAHAELQQAADVAAAAVESGAGDAPHERAKQLARANGADTVKTVDENGGTKLRIVVTGRAPAAFGIARGRKITATAWATLPPPMVIGDFGPNPPGQYAGPLVNAGGVLVCPAVATAFAAMSKAARSDGVVLQPTSGFRTFAQQAVLYAQLGPGIAAPPGVSRHHDATELDISVGPAGSTIHRWLSSNGPRFGFHQRYSWEPWHWGFVRGC